MKSLKTRIATGIMAGVMTMSLAVPAFATNTTKVTAAYQEIPIQVTVPQTGEVILNPMGMPVTLVEAKAADAEAGTPAVEAVIAKGQLVTKPLAIVSKTSTALKVGATVTTTIKGDLTFATTGWATTDPTKAPKTKSAFVYLGMATGSTVVNDAKDGVDADKVATQVAAIKVKDTLTTAEAVAAEVKQETKSIVVLKEDEATTNGVLTTDNKKCYIGKLAAYDATVGLDDSNVGVVYMVGQLADDPAEAWTKADGFTSTIVFTFSA